MLETAVLAGRSATDLLTSMVCALIGSGEQRAESAQSTRFLVLFPLLLDNVAGVGTEELRRALPALLRDVLAPLGSSAG